MRDLKEVTKQSSTYMTAEKAAAARENMKKYAWLRAQVYEKYIVPADRYVEIVDQLYDLIPSEGIPRSNSVGAQGDPEMLTCRYCKANIGALYGSYPWKHDPLNKPWKVQCPHCTRWFPSNDFGAFYKLGLNDYGEFDYELAHKKNRELVEQGQPGYLVNELYPETEELFGVKDWGVDDGRGYLPGRIYENGVAERHTYIAQFVHFGLWANKRIGPHKKNGIIVDALSTCSYAYFYTGDVKYGRVTAILLDRLADFYPDYDLSPYGDTVWNSDGGAHRGKTMGKIWETFNARDFAMYYDMVFDVFDDQEVVSFLQTRASRWKMRNPKDSGNHIRQNVESGLLRTIFEGLVDCSISGNFGFPQLANAVSAVTLDHPEDTPKWLDYLFAAGWSHKAPSFGGGIDEVLIDRVDADGQGDEASNYNNAWHKMLIEIADVLDGYEKYPAANLYNNPKFLQMFYSTIPLLSADYSPQIGDSGSVQSRTHWMSQMVAQKGFRKIGDPIFAQILYLLNGNSSDGLRDEYTEKDPEKLAHDVQKVINTYGPLDLKSDMMTHFGFAILRDGTGEMSSENEMRRDAWLYFGSNTGHGHRDTLNLGMTAYGLNILPELGYPELTGYQPNRLQWVSSTFAHNTVMVNEQPQEGNYELRGNCLHFDHTENVKLVDVDAAYVYPDVQAYRRSLIMVKINDRDSYTVDLFRVLSGSSHLYSFHAASDRVSVTKGLHLIPQADEQGNYVGSYVGPDVPFGSDPNSPAEWFYDTHYPRGYTWVEHIDRDADPCDIVELDFPICDFLGKHPERNDIGLSVTMLNGGNRNGGGTLSLSVADGYPPKKKVNEQVSKLKYVFAQIRGENLDTVFTTVLEPYRGQKNLVSVEELPVVPVSGPAPANAAYRALKINHKSGRYDYVLYATDNSLLLQVTDGALQFQFRGFIGVLFTENGEITYRYVHDGDLLADKQFSAACLCGELLDFTRQLSEKNMLTVRFFDAVSDRVLADLKGRYIYIDNGHDTRSGTYRILGANRHGATVLLDIGRITPIRKYVDAKKPELGYIYSIKEGQSFRIPLSFAE